MIYLYKKILLNKFITKLYIILNLKKLGIGTLLNKKEFTRFWTSQVNVDNL